LVSVTEELNYLQCCIIDESYVLLDLYVADAALMCCAGEIPGRPSSYEAWGRPNIYQVPVTTKFTYRCVGW